MPAQTPLITIGLSATPDQEIHDEGLSGIFALSCDGKYHMSYLLKDGEALVFDNARVLHARTGFNGHRHVRLTHVGSDEFYSRWRQLRHELKGDINLI